MNDANTFFNFPGQVAVVSGAAQGIGEAVTHRLAALGIKVAALDFNGDALERLASKTHRGVDKIHLFRVDVTDAESVEAAIEQIETTLGPIGMLANVAGILRLTDVVSMTDDDWNACFAVNVDGVRHLSQAVAKRMIPRRAGSIVTVGSNAALVPRMQMAAYAASKAAAHQFTRCLGLELATHGIRCNVVAAGSTDTPMQRQMWTDECGRDAVIAGSLATFRTGIPLGRIATPDDIASTIQFLLSEASRHITLHSLCVDGGATLGV